MCKIPARSELIFLVKRTCPQNEIPASPAKFLEPGADAQNLRHPANSTKVWQEDQAKKGPYLCKFSLTEPLSSSRQTKCPSQTKPQPRLHRWKKKTLAACHLWHILALFQPMDAFFPLLHGLFMSGGIPKLYHFHRMELSKTVAACTVPFLWAWILDHNFMPSRIKFFKKKRAKQILLNSNGITEII